METTHLRIDFSFGVEKSRSGLPVYTDDGVRTIRAIQLEAINIFGNYTMLPVFLGSQITGGAIDEESGVFLSVVLPCKDREEAQYGGDIRSLVDYIKSSVGESIVQIVRTRVAYELM